MAEHSLLSPSSAPRWMLCPGSVAASAVYPDTTSEYAEEGALAHRYAAALLTGEPFAESAKLTREMTDAVGVYVQTVDTMSQGAEMVWIEEPLDLSRVLGVADEKGTGDFIALIGTELQVHDLKYGKGVPVDAEGNWQLILYGLGALDLVTLVADVATVRLVIHQPRLNSVSEVVYTIDEMNAFQDRLRLGAGKALSCLKGEKPFEGRVPGEKQCKFCAAKADCPELAATCASVVDDFDVLDGERTIRASKMDNLAKHYALLPLVKLWAKAVEDAAFDRMLAGEQMPGFKLVAGRAGARAWDNEEQAEEMMKSMRLKVDEMYDRKLISPTKAEALLSKVSPGKWTRLQSCVTRSDPKPAVVPESDKRPALVMSAVADDFESLV